MLQHHSLLEQMQVSSGGAEAEGVHGHGSLHFRRVSLAFGPKNALCEVTIVRVPAGQLSDCTSLSG